MYGVLCVRCVCVCISTFTVTAKTTGAASVAPKLSPNCLNNPFLWQKLPQKPVVFVAKAATKTAFQTVWDSFGVTEAAPVVFAVTVKVDMCVCVCAMALVASAGRCISQGVDPVFARTFY